MEKNKLLVIEDDPGLHRRQQENRHMQQSAADSPLAGIVTRDPGMLKLCGDVERVAPLSASVTLLGAAGSGKELLARALHMLGGRAAHRFVTINCAAISEQLLESELFGYDRGGFSGSLGKLELAHHGTLFLDDVAAMAPALQARLLRFVQQPAIVRIGGRTEAAIDVRIVCATEADLASLVQQGRFSADLFDRLGEIVMRIPSLRERSGDSALLARHFRNRFCMSEGRAMMALSEAALAAIVQHAWPGNVRELEWCIRRAVIMADGPTIDVADLDLPGVVQQRLAVNLRQARDAAEYEVMVMALARTNGCIAKAAELLGVSRPTVYDLMNYHGIRN